MPAVQKIEPQRVSVTIPEAAAMVGLGITAFRDHVLPELRVIAVGSARLIAVDELRKWAGESGTLVRNH